MAELLSRAENCSENPSTSQPLRDLVNLYVMRDVFCFACLWEHLHVLVCRYATPFLTVSRRKTSVLVQVRG